MPRLWSAALLGIRAMHVIMLVAIALPGFLGAVGRRGSRRREHVAENTARLLERLGGAFCKIGQLLATRVDLVGTDMAAALGRLHDQVAPMSARQALRAARASSAALPAAVETALRTPPVASGSIACVYRAHHQGEVLALKVRRPGIGRRFAADIALARLVARVAVKMPMFRRVPVVDIVEQLSDSLYAQLDFVQEVMYLRRMRADLAGFAEIIIPDVVETLCSECVIVMEYIEGLDRSSADHLPQQIKEEGLRRFVSAVYHMLFVQGFIHVDLHQGNVYFTVDGRVVILDAGFMFQLSAIARLRFTQFFAGMIRGDGECCAETLLSTVRHAEPDADLVEFRRDVAALVSRSAGVAAADFDLVTFSVELFDAQRRHRLFAEPEFAFPLLCLLSLEGTVRRLHPLMNFQLEAAPYVMHGLLRHGTVIATP